MRQFLSYRAVEGGSQRGRQNRGRKLILFPRNLLRIILGPVLFFTLTIVSEPGAQPVPVAPLSTNGFQGTDFQPVFDYARNASSTADWEAMIGHGRYLLAARWEAEVDAQIDAQVAAVGQSDYFNNVAEYRDYLRKELLLQKNDAYTGWEQAADAEIENQRDTFVTALTAAHAAASRQSGENDFQSADTPNRSAVEFGYLKNQWESQYQGQVSAGLQQYQTSFSTLQQDYQKFLSELNQSETAFAQNLQQIQSYESVVRKGIEQSAKGLEQTLATNYLFYEENCNSNYQCTTDPNTLNNAGLQLQGLIANVRQGLTDNAPLSTLAKTMSDYLSNRQTETISTVNHWNSLTRGTSNWNEPNPIFLAKKCVETGAFGICIREEDPLAKWQITAVQKFLDSGDESQLRTELGKILPKTIQSIQRSGTDLHGNSSAGFRGALEINSAGHNQTYSAHGAAAFEYDSGIVCGPECLLWTTAREEYVNVSVRYTWYDSNADHNKTVWQGYADDLAPILLEWQNEILPAIGNWESQTATYQSNYTAWLAEAASKRQQAATAYQSSVAELESNRNRWITQMERQHREQSARWRTVQAQLQTTASSSTTQNPNVGLAAVLSGESQSVLQQLFNTPTPAARIFSPGPARSNAFRSDVAFLNRGNQFAPQSDVLKRTLGAFQKSALGSTNLAVSTAYHDQAIKRHERALGQLLSVVDAQNGAISQMRNMPDPVRKIDEQLGDLYSRLESVKAAEPEGAKKASSALTALNDKIEGIQKKRSKLMADDLKNHTDASFRTYHDKNGNLVMKRDIASGTARRREGRDGKNTEDYDRETAEQTVSIAPPDALRLAAGGALFENWDYADLDKQFAINQNHYESKFEDHINFAAESMQGANAFARNREQAYQQHTQELVAAAKIPDQAFEAIARSMMGGMGIGAAASQFVEGQFRSRIAQAIGDATGLPVGFLANILGGMSHSEAFNSYAESEINNRMYQAAGDHFGVPAELISTLISNREARKAKKEAKKQQRINTVITVAAVAGAAFTGGASLGALAVIKGAQGAAMGYQSGGLQGALAGAVGGAASAYVESYTGGAVSVGLSYTPEDGFGASASVGYGPAKLSVSHSQRGGTTAGLTLGFDTGGGGKLGLNTSYNTNTGFSGQVGYRTDSFTLAANYSPGAGLSAYAGATIGKDGMHSAGIGYSKREGASAYIQRGSSEKGAGRLSYSDRDGFGAEVKNANFSIKTTQDGGNTVAVHLDKKKKKGQASALDGSSLDVSYNTKTGLKASTKLMLGGQNLTFRYDDQGGGLTASPGINAKYFEKATDSAALANGYDPQGGARYDRTDGLFISDVDQLSGAVDSLATARQKEYQLSKKLAYLANQGSTMTPDELTRLAANDPKAFSKLLHDAGLRESRANGQVLTTDNKTTREPKNLSDTIFGAIEDAARGIGLAQLSDDDGYIDENGVYHQRTCFVAGTLVRVHPEATGAFEENGNWYKRIEKVRSGDLVLSWNEQDDSVDYRSVMNTSTRTADRIYTIRYKNGTTLNASWSHPFYISGRGWVQAKDLRAGDHSYTAGSIRSRNATASSSTSSVANDGPPGEGELLIESVDSTARTSAVYNFEVDGFHTYFVSESNILVHNQDLHYLWGDIMRFESGHKLPAIGTEAYKWVTKKVRACAGADGVGVTFTECIGAYYKTMGEAWISANGGELVFLKFLGKPAAGSLRTILDKLKKQPGFRKMLSSQLPARIKNRLLNAVRGPTTRDKREAVETAAFLVDAFSKGNKAAKVKLIEHMSHADPKKLKHLQDAFVALQKQVKNPGAFPSIGRTQLHNTLQELRHTVGKLAGSGRVTPTPPASQRARNLLNRIRTKFSGNPGKNPPISNGRRQSLKNPMGNTDEARRTARLQPYPTRNPTRTYHRKNSSSQKNSDAKLQQKSQEMWGEGPRNNQGGEARVKAYKGSLPRGEAGVQFQTGVPHDKTNHPNLRTWTPEAGRPGVRQEDGYAKIKVWITKIVNGDY